MWLKKEKPRNRSISEALHTHYYADESRVCSYTPIMPQSFADVNWQLRSSAAGRPAAILCCKSAAVEEAVVAERAQANPRT